MSKTYKPKEVRGMLGITESDLINWRKLILPEHMWPELRQDGKKSMYVYTEKDIENIKAIKDLRQEGLSYKEIRDVLSEEKNNEGKQAIYTSGQVKEILGISQNQLRHWRERVLPASRKPYKQEQGKKYEFFYTQENLEDLRLIRDLMSGEEGEVFTLKEVKGILESKTAIPEEIKSIDNHTGSKKKKTFEIDTELEKHIRVQAAIDNITINEWANQALWSAIPKKTKEFIGEEK